MASIYDSRTLQDLVKSRVLHRDPRDLVDVSILGGDFGTTTNVYTTATSGAMYSTTGATVTDNYVTVNHVVKEKIKSVQESLQEEIDEWLEGVLH